MLLGEGLENVLLKILSDPNSGVLNYKTAVRRPIPEGGLLRPDKYGAMGPVIFDGVVNHVHQDLLQVQRISDGFAMPQAGILQLQPDFPFLRQRRKHRDTVFQNHMKVKGLLHRRQSSALQLADLKHVVHQGQQMLR